MTSHYYPLRPARTSQQADRRPGRTRSRVISTTQRPGGWRMAIIILAGRPGMSPAIAITTRGSKGGGSRVHVELSDLADLEDAIAACRAEAKNASGPAAAQPGARRSVAPKDQ